MGQTPLPRCPFCNAQGAKNFISTDIDRGILIYCAQCGAVHGVLPFYPVYGGQGIGYRGQGTGEAVPEASPPSPPEGGGEAVPEASPPSPPEGGTETPPKPPIDGLKQATKSQSEAILASPGGYYDWALGDIPLCPVHKIPLVERTIPEGYKNAGKKLWVCLKYHECKHSEAQEP